MKSRFFEIIIFASFLFLSACSSSKINLSPRNISSTHSFDLTIIHSNDLHGMILPFNYVSWADSRREENIGGLSRRATLIKKIRAATIKPTLLLDAGDVFRKGPWETKYYGKPEIEVMNYLKYDAGTLGNHEFKITTNTYTAQEKLFEFISWSKFPWIVANWHVSSSGKFAKGVSPYITKEINGVKIGILGLTSQKAATYPQTSSWFFHNPIEVAKYYLPIMKRECDIVIALTHIGYGLALEGGIGLDSELAEEVDGIDAIVGGDSHTFIEKPILVENRHSHKKIPIVQTGEQGIRLGVLNLSFEKISNNKFELKKVTGNLIKVDSSILNDKHTDEILNEYNLN